MTQCLACIQILLCYCAILAAAQPQLAANSGVIQSMPAFQSEQPGPAARNLAPIPGSNNTLGQPTMLVMPPAGSSSNAIWVAGPMSFTGRLSFIGRGVANATELGAIWWNQFLGGVLTDTGRQFVGVALYDDRSSPARARAVLSALQYDPGVQFLLAPYSSSQAQASVDILNSGVKPALACCVGLDRLFRTNGTFFSLNVPSSRAMANLAQSYLAAGARSARAIIDTSNSNFPSTCNASSIPASAVFPGQPDALEFLPPLTFNSRSLSPAESAATVERLLDEVEAQPVDLLFSCTFLPFCTRFILRAAERKVNIRGSIYNQCVDNPDFRRVVIAPSRNVYTAPAQYATGLTYWIADVGNRRLLPEGLLPGCTEARCWSPPRFQREYKSRYNADPTFQAANQFAAMQLIAYATNSSMGDTRATTIASKLRCSNFPTISGAVQFDRQGLTLLQSRGVQPVRNTTPSAVAPNFLAEERLQWPAPTWEERDCKEVDRCSGNGFCLPDGTCDCEDAYIGPSCTVPLLFVILVPIVVLLCCAGCTCLVVTCGAANARVHYLNEQHENTKRQFRLLQQVSDQTLQRTLATAWHELSNPTFAVVGGLSMLSATRLSPQQQDSVRELERSAQHMARVLTDMQQSAGSKHAGWETVRVHGTLLSDVMRDVHHRVTAGLHIPVQQYYEAEPRMLALDPLRTKQVLTCLAGNAAQLTQAAFACRSSRGSRRSVAQTTSPYTRSAVAITPATDTAARPSRVSRWSESSNSPCVHMQAVVLHNTGVLSDLIATAPRLRAGAESSVLRAPPRQTENALHTLLRQAASTALALPSAGVAAHMLLHEAGMPAHASRTAVTVLTPRSMRAPSTPFLAAAAAAGSPAVGQLGRTEAVKPSLRPIAVVDSTPGASSSVPESSSATVQTSSGSDSVSTAEHPAVLRATQPSPRYLEPAPPKQRKAGGALSGTIDTVGTQTEQFPLGANVPEQAGPTESHMLVLIGCSLLAPELASMAHTGSRPRHWQTRRKPGVSRADDTLPSATHRSMSFASTEMEDAGVLPSLTWRAAASMKWSRVPLKTFGSSEASEELPRHTLWSAAKEMSQLLGNGLRYLCQFRPRHGEEEAEHSRGPKLGKIHRRLGRAGARAARGPGQPHAARPSTGTGISLARATDSVPRGATPGTPASHEGPAGAARRASSASRAGLSPTTAGPATRSSLSAYGGALPGGKRGSSSSIAALDLAVFTFSSSQQASQSATSASHPSGAAARTATALVSSFLFNSTMSLQTCALLVHRMGGTLWWCPGQCQDLLLVLPTAHSHKGESAVVSDEWEATTLLGQQLAGMRQASAGLSSRTAAMAPLPSVQQGTAAALAAPMLPVRAAPRVLVVDDEAVNRKICTSWLRRMGHEVHTAKDGVEFLDALVAAQERGVPYDLVLLDIIMPRLGGFHALKQATRMPGLDKLPPVVAMTANASQSDLVAYSRIGFCGCLPKPFNGSDFEAAVNRFVGKPRRLDTGASEGSGPPKLVRRTSA